MKIISVKGENLLSMGDFELTFQDSGLVLVEGWNYDDGRANGAGKTAIFNLLCLAIYQKLPRKITMSEVLKRGEKRGEVSATVLAGDAEYSMSYGRPKKRVVKKNGVEISITQEELEQVLGLSYQQFLTAMYTVQGGSDRFLNKNDTEKKEFLLQLQNLDAFADCRKEVHGTCKVLEAEITTLTLNMEKAKSKLEVYGETTVDESNLKSKIDMLTSDIQELNKAIIRDQKIIKPDLSKFYQLEAQIRDKYNNFATIRGQRDRLAKDCSILSRKIVDFTPSSPDAHCPQCSAALSIINGTVAAHADQTALHKQHDDYMKQLELEKSSIVAQIKTLDESLYEEQSIKDLEVKIRNKKDSELTHYNNAQSNINNHEFIIKNKQLEIIRLNDQIQQCEEIKNKVQILSEFITKTESALQSKKKDLELNRDILEMYSPTGAPAYVMDAIIESFNEAINEYTGLIWPSASYQLKSYKEKSTGDISSKFSETLIINGQTTSIGALSGGEQRAFSLSIDFAVADILSKQFGVPLNPMIMDEPFEGLDATGREVVIELLEKLAVNRQIWVIDHMSESKALFEKIVRVEKRNGTSKILPSM